VALGSRPRSFSGHSILMISAPNAPSQRVAHGPARTQLKSTTRIPASAFIRHALSERALRSISRCGAVTRLPLPYGCPDPPRSLPVEDDRQHPSRLTVDGLRAQPRHNLITAAAHYRLSLSWTQRGKQVPAPPTLISV